MSGYIVASPFVTCCEFKGSGRERERKRGSEQWNYPIRQNPVASLLLTVLLCASTTHKGSQGSLAEVVLLNVR